MRIKISRKASLSILVGFFLFFYAGIIFYATQPRLPNADHPIKLYSNQTRHDIKLTYLQALSRANQSIFLSVYGITDPEVLSLVRKKALQKLPITVEYDPTASFPLKKLLPESIHITPIHSSGLMHRKIVLIDKTQVFLGSANLTSSSLRHHANLVVGIYHPQLAAFLEAPTAPSYSFDIEGQHGEIYLLPDRLKSGLSRLISLITQAKKTIKVAMFTLTHSEIAQALIQANEKGVAVSIAIDAYTARGASKKTISALEKSGIKIFASQGRELLHHKWAIIDDKELVTGSANWTKAAFTKNHEFLLFLSPLKQKQVRFFKQLWTIIESESIDAKEAA